MAAVGDEPAGCDGCGRTAPLEELTTVTMPDGEQVVCCQHCEPHARAAAERGGSLDQRRDTCDGCTGTFRLAELEDVVLDDGTVVTCCPSCVAQAPNRDDDGGSDTDGTDEDITEGPTAATDSERSTEAGPTRTDAAVVSVASRSPKSSFALPQSTSARNGCVPTASPTPRSAVSSPTSRCERRGLARFSAWTPARATRRSAKRITSRSNAPIPTARAVVGPPSGSSRTLTNGFGTAIDDRFRLCGPKIRSSPG